MSDSTTPPPAKPAAPASLAAPAPPPPQRDALTRGQAPFLHAPEGINTVFLVTLAAACGPLAAGLAFFGWRALAVAGLCVAACGIVESLVYSFTRVPALLGRSHAYLTGLLLALTLPPFTPWYVAVTASVFAIVVGKAVFGGVGHFLWQPALVGRLAVAVLFPVVLDPPAWPLLAQSQLVVGDAAEARRVDDYASWRQTPPPDNAHAFLIRPPVDVLGGLTEHHQPQFSALLHLDDQTPQPKPAALLQMPPVNDLLYGARPGGIGETSAIIILIAGLYLIYRTYIKWQLPLMFLLAAAAVAAVAPVYLARPGDTVLTVWWPFLHEGPDVGFVYVCYQLLSGEMLLAAFFLATEMTTRPVTAGGQVIFALGCGALAMGLQLYLQVPIPAYMAILAMNTFVPAIDALWRPRVFGRPLFWRLRRRREDLPQD